MNEKPARWFADKRNGYLSLSALALSLGFLIYYCFRSGDMLIHQWFDFLPRNTAAIALSHPSVFIDFVRYNLPDGLWLLSGLLFLRVVWHEQPETFLIYRRCFLCMAFLLEIAQVFNSVPGAFDIFDVVTMGSIALLERILYKVHLIRRES